MIYFNLYIYIYITMKVFPENDLPRSAVSFLYRLEMAGKALQDKLASCNGL